MRTFADARLFRSRRRGGQLGRKRRDAAGPLGPPAMARLDGFDLKDARPRLDARGAAGVEGAGGGEAVACGGADQSEAVPIAGGRCAFAEEQILDEALTPQKPWTSPLVRVATS